MAFFEGSIYSQSLQMNTSISVSIPNDLTARPENGFPVLYMLHGLTDNHTAWTRNSNIDRYACERQLAVVMPEVQRSFYTDMEYGLRYFTYISDELPKLCRQMFGFSPERDDTFVAGLSMGGFGALKCAFQRPDVFFACAGISSVVNLKSRVVDFLARSDLRSAFGDISQISDSDDLIALARTSSRKPPESRPHLFLCCGSEDFFIEDNRNFINELNTYGIQNEYHESKGSHQWAYWEAVLPQVLDFFKEIPKLK